MPTATKHPHAHVPREQEQYSPLATSAATLTRSSIDDLPWGGQFSPIRMAGLRRRNA